MSAEHISFEKSLDELKGIVEDLENGDLPLNESLERFQSGIGLNEPPRSKLRGITLETYEGHNSCLYLLGVECIFSCSQDPLFDLQFLQSHHRSTVPLPTIAL